MNRIIFAFKSFFAILFGGRLPADVAEAYGFSRRGAQRTAPPKTEARVSDGALQLLMILQRDSRLVDFLMEDISSYADDQVGAAVRDLHSSCRQALLRHVTLAPLIDGVEGSFTRLEAESGYSRDASALKLLGNVPADGKVSGGLLRHKGWKAAKVDLPPLPTGQNLSIVAPAEIEIE